MPVALTINGHTTEAARIGASLFDMAEALGFDPPAGLTERTLRDDVLPLDEPDPEAGETPEPSAP